MKFLSERAEYLHKIITEEKVKICKSQDTIYEIMMTNCIGRRHKYGYKVGLEECPKSSIGICVYDAMEDPAWDDCIYCHKPNERK